jgi:hypothetical protein
MNSIYAYLVNLLQLLAHCNSIKLNIQFQHCERMFIALKSRYQCIFSTSIRLTIQLVFYVLAHGDR